MICSTPTGRTATESSSSSCTPPTTIECGRSSKAPPRAATATTTVASPPSRTPSRSTFHSSTRAHERRRARARRLSFPASALFTLDALARGAGRGEQPLDLGRGEGFVIDQRLQFERHPLGRPEPYPRAVERFVGLSGGEPNRLAEGGHVALLECRRSPEEV